MTEDPNLIFTLRAISDPARNIYEYPHNKRFYVSRPSREVAAASRESSVATNIGDEDCEGNGNKEEFGQQLRFKFDQKPKNTDRGFVFGSNPKTCDVILGRRKDGISGLHFRITFDGQGRLVLIDLSTHGTAVSYGGQSWDEKRKNPPDRTRNKLRNKSNDFTWILFPEMENKRITIGHRIDELPNAPVIEFSVEVADPKTASKQYRELRNAYLDEMRTAIPFGLNIDSQLTTACQTESQSPKQTAKQRPIWIDLDEIGRGVFGTVNRAVNVSTGEIYAAKTILGNDKDGRKRWDTEVALLRKVSHDHIVKFVDHDVERERPRLIMEYLPLGNLAEQNEIGRITEWETITLLCQGLSALSYLHLKNIVHRDLKPQNILVQCREPANFCIKMADFGLARDGSHLKTVCGTCLYAAPEIFKNRPYTAKVDIWSLGVIAFQYAYDLPEVPEVRGQFNPRRWYHKLTRLIGDWDSDGLLDLLKSSMLRMDPCERLSASECLIDSAKLREAIIPAQNLDLDPGTPTEAMSSSAIMRGLRAAGFKGGQQVAADEAETLTNPPTLRTLKSGCRPEDCPEMMTQKWDPLGEAACRPKKDEGSEQEVEIGTGNNSGLRHSKRQRMEQPGNELLPNSKQKRYGDQVLIEHPPSGCIQMVVQRKAVSLRKSDCWLNATQVLGLAGKTAYDRDHILEFLKQHTNVQVVRQARQQSWIPYQDGHFLCEFLQLTDTLRPLLEYGLKQGMNFDEQTNYFFNPSF